MRENFVCHSDKQEQIIFSDYPITAAITGIQFAKTTSGSWWLKRHAFTHTRKEDNFIICAPTYKILNQSTLPAFLRIMEPFGSYKRGESEFKIHGGGTIYFRTGTDPDSIVGITDVRAIWGDEAGKFSLYFWENIQARASFRQAPILLTSTPYTMNWFFKEILKPFKAGTRDDILVIQAKSCDNPYFPMAEYLRKKATMDPRRFNATYNGEFEKMHGLVYDCFDEDTHTVAPFMLPFGTQYYAGVDWGTTHPFAITVRAITPNGDHYQVGEFYKTGLTIRDMVLAAQKMKQVWGIKLFYCDPARPDNIEEFNRNDCPAIGAKNDIRFGVDLHYELIKSGKFKIFKNSSPYTIDELESYHYPEPADLKADQDDREQLPVDASNHALDSARYVTVETYHRSTKNDKRDAKSDRHIETMEKRIARLKRGSRNKHTESWGA